MIDTCHYSFVKSIESTIPKVNPKVNNRIWVIMLCQGLAAIVTATPSAQATKGRELCKCGGTG